MSDAPFMPCPQCWGARAFAGMTCSYCIGEGHALDVPLSPHFWLSEFLRSETAVRLHMANVPGPDELAHLYELAAALENVRDVLGVPLRVSSGYRAPPLNRAIGSDDDSAHPHGWAADLEPVGMTVGVAMQKLAASGLAFDQVFYEPWLHFGLWRPFEHTQRREIAVFLPGATGRRVKVPFDPTDARQRALTGVA